MPTRKPYLLRIDPELYATLERWAADELRSVNAQIEFLLTDAVRRAGRDRRRREEPPAPGSTTEPDRASSREPSPGPTGEPELAPEPAAAEPPPEPAAD